MTEYIAHVSEDKSRLHLIEDHLTGVADLAAVMAAEFGASEWAYLAGLWHDLGKYSHEFQSMIRSSIGSDASTETKSGRVDHSTAGGIHAVDSFGGLGRVFAYIIAGHHAGLPDWQCEVARNKALAERLKKRDLLGGFPIDGIPESFSLRRFRSGNYPQCGFCALDPHALLLSIDVGYSWNGITYE